VRINQVNVDISKGLLEDKDRGVGSSFVTGLALAVRNFYKHGNCIYKVKNTLEELF